MNISMQIIADSLSDSEYQLQSHLSDGAALNLAGARLLPPSRGAYDSGHVYIAALKDLDCALPTSCKNLIITDTGDGGGLPEGLKSGTRNIIVVRNGPTVATLLNEISDIFSFHAERMADLLLALANDAPISKVLNVASHLFGNPMFMLDTALTAIAYTQQSEGGVGLNEETWFSIVQKKHVTLNTVNYYASKEPPQNQKKREPFFHSVNPHIYNSIRLNIFVDDLSVGRIAIVDDCHPLKQGHLAIAEVVVPLISGVMRKEMATQSFEQTGLEQFICRQLDGFEYTDLSMVQKLISIRGWNITDKYYLVKVVNESETPNEAFAYTMREARKIFGEDCVLVLYRSAGVFIVNVRKNSKLPEQWVERIVTVGEMHSLKIGVSMLFERFNALSEHYALVTRIIEVGRLVAPAKKIYYYDAFSFHMLLYEFSKNSEAIHIKTLCCSEALTLHDHDEKNDTNLLESLATYLLMERSLKKAAEKLHMHRNSLVYRLEKINDIIAVDVDDAAVRAKIIMSFEILRHDNSRNRRKGQGIPPPYAGSISMS